ncbi:hypothetical protein E2C01_026413 [Portunus trituberculatus]|uniref:Uncharacterized protein n=1 Tax=Portunus trituberculatus TaxID=210409 RepID=A0A5B7EJ38_PORTR|nr:hypothetical protein [Portunus trituberculatus]
MFASVMHNALVRDTNPVCSPRCISLCNLHLYPPPPPSTSCSPAPTRFALTAHRPSLLTHASSQEPLPPLCSRPLGGSRR